MDTVIKIIIYDKQQLFAFAFKEKIEQFFQCLNEEYEHICQIYYESSKLLEDIRNNQPHLIFLNVESTDSVGFDIAEEIVQKELKSRIIFISSNDELVFKAFTYFPYYFLRKRKIDKELLFVLYHYVCEWEKEKNFLFQYRLKGEIYQINSEEIVYLTYYNHKITLVLLNGKIEFRGRILDCEAQLQQNCFFKANAGTIINFNHCKSLGGGIFTMCNGDKITVSRDKKKRAEEKFYLYR